MDQSTPNVLQDMEHEITLTPVSNGTRFANYLIDLIVFYALIFVFGMIFGAAMYTSNPDFDADGTLNSGSGIGMMYLFYFIIFFLNWGLLEAVTKGRTLGKMVTGTVAVKEDGSPITGKDAFLRALCRLIPFEAFSTFFGRPWHDSITKTMVIKKTR